MTTETARRAILESIGNTRDVIEQARMEGAALRGELGVAAQILAMSELYKRLKAQAEIAAERAEAPGAAGAGDLGRRLAAARACYQVAA
jgi:hypothetical protein